MKKVSFICTSYRRFYCVRRIISQFLSQTYSNVELIIFNTDVEYPFTDVVGLPNIKVINNNLDYITGKPYTNRGDICRDAVTHATGDYFMLADDDDVYLPWHIQQAVEGIEEIGQDAWKPEKSLFAAPGKIELVQNTMEASVIVKMDRIREIGFRSDLTGYEGLSWYTILRDEGQLNEHNKNYIPSYCFNWSDPPELAGHKQSGDIDNPKNFDNHKLASGDYATGPLTPLSISEVTLFYKPYIEWIRENVNQLNSEYYNRYFRFW